MILHNVLQGSPEWKACRVGIPTASEFKRLVTSTGKPSESLALYAGELAAELFAGKSLDQFDGNTWMDRGKEMEAEAVRLYEFTNDVEAQRVGFITNDAGTAGCSPDALIGDDGGLEIKCLKSERHVEAVHYYKKHAKTPSAYVLQVQGSLMITGRAFWDLMFHHPDMPPLVIRNTPDPAIHAALAQGIAAVIAARDEQLRSLRGEA